VSRKSSSPKRKFEYKNIPLVLDTDMKVALDMMTAGHKVDDSVSEKVLQILIGVTNEHGKNGWKLYSWALQPVPYVLLEKET
jgi:hypothetical protein